MNETPPIRGREQQALDSREACAAHDGTAAGGYAAHVREEGSATRLPDGATCGDCATPCALRHPEFAELHHQCIFEPSRFARSVALLALALLPAVGNCATVDRHLVDAVALVETGHRNVAGDNGRAAGVWQMHAAACSDAGITHVQAWHREAAGAAAARYLRQLGAQLGNALRREPSAAQLYAAWNLGFEGFRRRRFDLRRCPAITRQRAMIVESAVIDRRYSELIARGVALAATRPQPRTTP